MANTYGTFSADGSSSVQSIRGPFVFKANGTWGGGTVVVQVMSRDGSTYKTLTTATALTSDATGQVLYDMPLNSLSTIRATLAGSTSPSLAWEFIGDIRLTS